MDSGKGTTEVRCQSVVINL